eukprot:scaffold3450_cov114-Cylindrotheca_fusiformis.AAC.45
MQCWTTETSTFGALGSCISPSEQQCSILNMASQSSLENVLTNEEESSGITATQSSLTGRDPKSSSNLPSVCCAFLASMTTGATTYAFGLYGSTLQRNLRLSQSQLVTISTAAFFAGLFSWIPGMFIDRFGTRLGISLGGLTGSSALLIYWAVAKRFIEIFNSSWVVFVLSALGVVIFLSCALVTGSVFKILGSNCGLGTKGAAVGVAKAYVGLGAGTYACLFESIRTPSTSDLDLLPMLATFFLVAASIPSWIILPNKQNEGNVPDVLTPNHFRVLYCSLIILAVLIVSTSLSELYSKEQESSKEASPNYFLTVAILSVWIGPIVGQHFLPRNEITAALALIQDEEQETLLEPMESNLHEPTSDFHADSLAKLHSPENTNEASENSDAEDDIASVSSERGGSKNLYQMLQTPEAWLMIWTTTILVGAGTVETNNLGQMVDSLGFRPVVTSASNSIFSVAQAAGRVATGALSESALVWNTKRCLIDKGVPRPFFLVAASVVAILAHSILAASTSETPFVIGMALSGYSFGMVWPMMVLIVGELFGTAHVGANYLFFDGFTSAGGTFLLSKIVAQDVYEAHIVSDDKSGGASSDSARCIGQQCFQLTHVAIAILCVTCVVSSLIMQYLTRHSYMSSHLA